MNGSNAAVLVSVALFCWASAESVRNMSQDVMSNQVLYRVGSTGDKTKSVTAKQNGQTLELHFAGFGRLAAFKVNGGGVETCRTTLLHNSDEATIELSLPIPVPNVPCSVMPGIISVSSRKHRISLIEKQVDRLSGSDTQLRAVVEKLLGEVKR